MFSAPQQEGEKRRSGTSTTREPRMEVTSDARASFSPGGGSSSATSRRELSPEPQYMHKGHCTGRRAGVVWYQQESSYSVYKNSVVALHLIKGQEEEEEEEVLVMVGGHIKQDPKDRIRQMLCNPHASNRSQLQQPPSWGSTLQPPCPTGFFFFLVYLATCEMWQASWHDHPGMCCRDQGWMEILVMLYSYITRILACSNAANRIISCAHMGGIGGLCESRGPVGRWAGGVMTSEVKPLQGHVLVRLCNKMGGLCRPLSRCLRSQALLSSALNQDYVLRRRSGRAVGE